MDITGTVRSITPVFIGTRELQRATFHIDGVSAPFVAFGNAARDVYDVALRSGIARVRASSTVEMRESHQSAYLADLIEAA